MGYSVHGRRCVTRRSKERVQSKRSVAAIDPVTGIWNLEQAKVHYFDEALAQAIVDLWPVPPIHTADLGCGKGDYCAYFTAKGWKLVDGYEGTPGIASIATYPYVKELDLSVYQPLREYEFVMSLECGEHIPRNREKAFVENIVSAAQNQLLLSWAVDGQSGIGHVNCHNNDYVIALLKTYGFNIDPVCSNRLREAATRPWFKNTLMWFYR